jgi:hypothetical protein
MGDVIVLRHEEGVRMDGTRIAAILRERGAHAAEAALTMRMAEMAVQITHMERHYRAGRMALVCRHGRRLQIGATDIGMRSFARVARDTRICAVRRDVVAFTATWARLLRIYDRSRQAVGEVRGASG